MKFRLIKLNIKVSIAKVFRPNNWMRKCLIFPRIPPSHTGATPGYHKFQNVQISDKRIKLKGRGTQCYE